MTRPDPQIMLDLLARHMWIADQLTKGIDGVDAADAWDGDDLLTDMYGQFETLARDAITAETKRRTEEAREAGYGWSSPAPDLLETLPGKFVRPRDILLRATGTPADQDNPLGPSWRSPARESSVSTTAAAPEMTWRHVGALLYGLVYWRGYRRLRRLVLGR